MTDKGNITGAEVEAALGAKSATFPHSLRTILASNGVFPSQADAVMRAALETLAASRVHPAEPVAWRCFHCDEVFIDENAARLHFGAEDGATPACQIKGSEGGLVEALRRAEKNASDAWFAIHNETIDAAKAYNAQSARHQEQLRAVEQVGYDRGIADAKAHPETIGLAVEALTPGSPL